LHSGPDLTRRADRHRRDVEHEAVVVEERLVADADPRSVLAAERRADGHAFADAPEQLSEDHVALVVPAVCGGVVPSEEVLRARKVGCELEVVSEVELAAQHPLLHLAHPRLRRRDRELPASGRDVPASSLGTTPPHTAGTTSAT